MSETQQAQAIIAIFVIAAGFALYSSMPEASAAAVSTTVPSPAAGVISAKQAIAMGIPVDPAIHLA